MVSAKRRIVGATLSAAGFTLVEILAAVSIIAVVLVGVHKLHSQTLIVASAARFYTTAPLLAQRKMAELQIKPLDELVEDSGDFGESFPGYTWSATIGDVESEYLDTRAQDLKRIDVAVSLNNGESVYSVRAYRFIIK